MKGSLFFMARLRRDRSARQCCRAELLRALSAAARAAICDSIMVANCLYGIKNACRTLIELAEVSQLIGSDFCRLRNNRILKFYFILLKRLCRFVRIFLRCKVQYQQAMFCKQICMFFAVTANFFYRKLTFLLDREMSITGADVVGDMVILSA